MDIATKAGMVVVVEENVINVIKAAESALLSPEDAAAQE